MIVKLDCDKHSHTWNECVQNHAHAVHVIIKQMTKMDLSKWYLAEVTTSSKGQKTCQLTNDHYSVSFNLGSNLKTRFGPSTFDKNVETSRKSLDFDITADKQITSMLKEIDEWAVEYLHANSARIMKKVMSKDVIRENYKPLVSQYGDNVRVKTKINTSGHRVCKCWDEDRQACDLPEDWLSNQYDVQVAIPHMWLMGSSFGLTMETTNLLVRPIQTDCPF